MTAPLYDRDILRLAATVPHLGRLDAPDARIERHARPCGSRFAADVRLHDGKIVALGLDVSACAFGQAAAHVMAAHAIGRTPAELAAARDALTAWLAGTRDDPGDWPGMERFARARPHSARHGAIRLPFETVAEAAEAAKAAAG